MIRLLTAFVMLALLAQIATAQSPVPVESVAKVNELELEAPLVAADLEKLLVDQAAFDKAKEGGGVRQGFGVLAVIGQALAEHPEGKDSKVNGPALRDAALMFKRDSTLDQAKAAFAAVQAVLKGEAPAEEHAQLHPWNKLTGMHGMMEEMNSRNSKILRVLRRIKGTPEESAHAGIQGILAIAMYADTHEVKDPAQLPQWHEWSTEYREAVRQMGDAIRAKDAKAASEWFDKAKATCDKCHEVFQK